MDLQQLAQAGEFIGGLSVLLTLIYLAVQIRGNTRAVRSAAAQQTHDALTDGYYHLAHDPSLNRIFRMGTSDLSTISEDEVAQLFAFWSGTLYLCQNWLYQSDAGALDEDLMNSFLNGVSSNFHAEGFKQYWNSRRATFSPKLQEWVDGVMAKPKAHEGWTTLGPHSQT